VVNREELSALISNERVCEGEKVLRSIGPLHPLLLDEGSDVLGRCALTVAKRNPLGWMLRKHGYAHPAVLVVGAGRRIEWAYVGKSYRDRPKVEPVLDVRGSESPDALVARLPMKGS
jgi:hypothetical protein